MRKQFIMILAVFAATTVALIGCDNRSQIEKDADKAASKMQDAMK